MSDEILKDFDLDGFWEKSRYGLSHSGKPVTDTMIAEVEAELGYKLPQSYLHVLQRQNGGIPVNTCFPTKEYIGWAEDHVAMTCLFGIDRAKNYSVCGRLGQRIWIEEWGYPEIGVAIADTPTAGHEMFFLDYRECGPEGEPRVAYVNQQWDYETTVIAESFESFVRQLVNADVFEEAINALAEASEREKLSGQ